MMPTSPKKADGHHPEKWEVGCLGSRICGCILSPFRRQYAPGQRKTGRKRVKPQSTAFGMFGWLQETRHLVYKAQRHYSRQGNVGAVRTGEGSSMGVQWRKDRAQPQRRGREVQNICMYLLWLLSFGCWRYVSHTFLLAAFSYSSLLYRQKILSHPSPPPGQTAHCDYFLSFLFFIASSSSPSPSFSLYIISSFTSSSFSLYMPKKPTTYPPSCPTNLMHTPTLKAIILAPPPSPQNGAVYNPLLHPPTHPPPTLKAIIPHRIPPQKRRCVQPLPVPVVRAAGTSQHIVHIGF